MRSILEVVDRNRACDAAAGLHVRDRGLVGDEAQQARHDPQRPGFDHVPEEDPDQLPLLLDMLADPLDQLPDLLSRRLHHADPLGSIE